MNAVGRRLFELNFGRPNIAPQETVRQLLARASEEGERAQLQPKLPDG